MVIQKLNLKDKRIKNLYLSEEAIRQTNNLISPTVRAISSAFQQTGSDSVNGFNRIFSDLIKGK